MIAGSRIRPAERLVAAADRGEAMIAKLNRARPAARGPRTGRARSGAPLALALAWRGLAALLGVGLATLLATSFSVAPNDEPSLSTLAEIRSDYAAARPVRDVSRIPQLMVQEAALGAVADARPAFAIDSGLLTGEPRASSRRSADGKLRVERVAFAGFGQDEAHLAMRLTTSADALLPDQPFAIAMMRATAEAGLSVQRSGQSSSLASRFGSAEIAEISLSDGERSRTCLGFRQRLPDAAGDLDGWWCPQGVPQPRDLACLIERIVPAAGTDRSLAAVLAKSGFSTPSCMPVRTASPPRRTTTAESRPAVRR